MPLTNKIIPWPGPRTQRKPEELAFLPAAIEIVETPPSPLGRAIAATIITIFCVALAWAAFGKIDIVASAPGKIVPSGQVKIVQPLEAGIISAIKVHDGARVKAGDVLIEFDPTTTEAELNHLQTDLDAARLDIARARAGLSGALDPVAEFHPPKGVSPFLVLSQRQLLIERLAEHHAKLAAFDRQRAQKRAERDTIIASIDKLEATIPVIQERLDLRKTLYSRELGSKLQYLELLQLLTDQSKELLVLKSRLQEAEEALAAADAKRLEAVAEYRRMLSGELVEAERKAAGLAQDVVKAAQRSKQQVLTAPVDGTVQQLAVHTVGGVVTPGQTLLVVVPRESPVEIEAMVSNRDVGFVRADQEAEIKVETFPFTRYGSLRGRVLSVSPDAIVRDRQQQGRPSNRRQTADTTAAAPQGQELDFLARVSLDRNQMQVDDQVVNLSPGMAVTVEIKTGSRTIMSYLLSPLVRHAKGSLRER